MVCGVEIRDTRVERTRKKGSLQKEKEKGKRTFPWADHKKWPFKYVLVLGPSVSRLLAVKLTSALGELPIASLVREKNKFLLMREGRAGTNLISH
jgi:hypothetical protein